MTGRDAPADRIFELEGQLRQRARQVELLQGKVARLQFERALEVGQLRRLVAELQPQLDRALSDFWALRATRSVRLAKAAGDLVRPAIRRLRAPGGNPTEVTDAVRSP